MLNISTASIYPSPPPSPLLYTFKSNQSLTGNTTSSLGSPPPLVPITPSPSISPILPSYPPHFDNSPYSSAPLPHPSQFELPPLRSLGLDPNPTSSQLTHTERYNQHIEGVIRDPAFLPRLTYKVERSPYPTIRNGLTPQEFRDNFLDPESVYWLSHDCQDSPGIVHTLPMAVRMNQAGNRITRIANVGRQLLGAIRFQVNRFEKEIRNLEDVRDDHLKDGHRLFDYMMDCGLDFLAKDFVDFKREEDANKENRRPVRGRSPTPGPSVSRLRRRSNRKRKVTRFDERRFGN